jgi:hypothetical protein
MKQLLINSGTDRVCVPIPTNFDSCNGSLVQTADRWEISDMAPALPWQWLYPKPVIKQTHCGAQFRFIMPGQTGIVLCSRPNNGHRIPNCRTGSGYRHPFCSVS